MDLCNRGWNSPEEANRHMSIEVAPLFILADLVYLFNEKYLKNKFYNELKS